MELLERVDEPPKGLDGWGRWRRFIGMKQILGIMATLMVLVGCGKSKEEQEFSNFMVAAEAEITAEAEGDDKKPLTKEESAKVIEVTIRKAVNKPTGELTKADLEKVTKLNFGGKKLTNVKGLGKLTHLEDLRLQVNQLTCVKGLEKLTKLTYLGLSGNQLTSLAGLEKLTQLRKLWLDNNHDLTKAQTDELKKALPKCDIEGP